MDITSAVTITNQDFNTAKILGTVLPPGRYKGTGMAFKSATLLCLEKNSIFLLPFDTTNVVHVKVEQSTLLDVLDGDLVWLTARQAPDGDIKVELNRGDTVPADGLHVATQGPASVVNENIIDFLSGGGVGATIYTEDDFIDDITRTVTVAGTLSFDTPNGSFNISTTQVFIERTGLSQQNRILVNNNVANGVQISSTTTSPLGRTLLRIEEEGFFIEFIGDRYVVIETVPAFDNDAAAGSGGVPQNGIWQTSATNTLGLPEHVLMIKA